MENRVTDREWAGLKLHTVFQGYTLPMNGKAPDVKMLERQRGTTAWKNHPKSFYNRPATDEEVREWAAGNCGISGITGERSGIVALDIDCPELLVPLLTRLPTFKIKTPTATSPSGGYSMLFRALPGYKHLQVSHPILDGPCSCGKNELGSFRAADDLIILPPGAGREWFPHLSITEVEPAEVPVGLLEALFDISRASGAVDNYNDQKNLPIGQRTGRNTPIEHPCPIGNTVLLEESGRYVLLEVSPDILKLVTDKDSPLIPALVTKLHGEGLRVPCPYHPPDTRPSAAFWHNVSGWYFADHHIAHNMPVSQICADLATGYLERCARGSENKHRHRVYALRKDGTYKVKVEAFVWLTLVAAELGLVELPPSRFPAKLDGFTRDDERILHFFDLWDRARRRVFNSDEIPLARTLLASALFAVPAPEKGEPKTEEWNAAYSKIEHAIDHAWRQGLLEKVTPGVKGFGGKATIFRVCDNGGIQ
jgi:hypothetical protein